MKYQRPRGTNDLTPAESPLWRHMRVLFERISSQFGYAEVAPPIFERTELFTRAVGEGTDVVEKEMYTFQDKKGRSLSLRPEGTAGVVRLVLENGLLSGGGTPRLCYWGPMFRYDRPQAGRYRQFHQLGVEAFGHESPAYDAEVIDLFVSLLQELGLGDLRVEIGSVGDLCCRPAYTEKLKARLDELGDALCKTCRTRAEQNPLRVFDCKVPGCKAALKDAPVMLDNLCEACEEHLARVEELLDVRGIAYERDRALVRGLDYYTRTVFEVHYPKLGAQSALGGGGRYDRLVEDCGGGHTPAVGFSAGIERLVWAIGEERSILPSAYQNRGAYLCLMSADAEPAAARIAGQLRQVVPVEVDFTGRSLKSQLKGANRVGARFAVILGDEELAARSATLKDLDSGEQKTLPEEQLSGLIEALVSGAPPQ